LSQAGPRYVIVVQKGRWDVFQQLKQAFRETTVWDRRASERRQAQRRTGRLGATLSGRRRAERRGGSPSTWESDGFVLTGTDAG
jgi:hypothetical protein